MKKYIFIILLFISSSFAMGQNTGQDKALEYLKTHGEVYFYILTDNPVADLRKVQNVVSVDKVMDSVIVAYANSKQFDKFLNSGLNYRVMTPPSMVRKPLMMNNINLKSIDDWDFYPTYEGYVSLMQQFETDYPGLCEMVSIDTLDSGRELLFIHINNDLNNSQNEPEFMYTSTMHGDEVTGYVLMLHYIDYLLSNYGVDSSVTNLVDNIDIWINPLANPDGTYHGGNNTVYGATRYNANGVDLNRNYPDPQAGPHPDGNDYQEETQAFMDFAAAHDFVMSANLHGGSEVANYPWDTWSKLTADDDWWYFVSREFADTIHAHAVPGYFTDLNNGVTNGYAWYSITGGRQDYMNYFQRCREFTLELSSDKTPPASQLPDFWDYTYRSFLNYMEESTFGIRGVITNMANGNPIMANVFVENHDFDNSDVYSSLPVGNYHRMLKAGEYSITYSAFGYYPQTISVSVNDRQATVQNVQLQPVGVILANFYADDTIISSGDSVAFFDSSFGDSIVSWQWTFPGGDPASSSEQNPHGIVYNQLGKFDVSLVVTDSSGEQSELTKTEYISVSETYLMQDGVITICDANFMDSGGENGNYSNNEDYVLTFYPATNNAKMVADFVNFDVEDESNCNYDYLKIFNGNSTDDLLIGTYCGTEIPGKIIATNSDGALTFEFHSDGMVTRPGWKAVMSCDTGVGIAENPLLSELIYPNPVSDILTVKSNDLIESVELTDVSGRVVKAITCSCRELPIDVHILPPGFYYVKITTGNHSVLKKLVIK